MIFYSEEKGHYSHMVRLVLAEKDISCEIKEFDPAEKLLPDIGVIKVRDPESGSSFWIDTSNRGEMEKLKNQINSDFDTFNKQAKKIGFDIISVSTNGDFVDPLISLFRKRDKR